VLSKLLNGAYVQHLSRIRKSLLQITDLNAGDFGNHGGTMRFISVLLFCLLAWTTGASAQDFGFVPISNEISYFKNSDDSINDLGETVQVVSINSFKALTWFNLEFTGDFNWDMLDDEAYDYYIEIGFVKQIVPRISLNYQRIYGTFVSEPVNQLGIRLSL
jgi:hypothetical protein